jgi:hypothetical protein
MRTLLLIFPTLLGSLLANATRPDLAVVFVHDLDGHPMQGAYASPIAAQTWLSTKAHAAWTVEMHFTVSKDYPYGEHEIGTHKSWPLTADTICDGRRKHLRFDILDCFCDDQYLLVIKGGDTMRIDMPNDVNNRGHLVHRMVARGGLLAAPEVVRFVPGRFNFVALAEDARYHEVEARIAERLLRDARKRSKRVASSGPMPVPKELRQKMEPEVSQRAEKAVRAKSKSMKKPDLKAIRGDTIVLRISGSVMLDGGCASTIPMMALEMRGNGGWKELIPMPEVQMDCGLSVIHWQEHELHIPVVEWIKMHGPVGMAILPGRYRLRFRGGDGTDQHTKAFRLK